MDKKKEEFLARLRETFRVEAAEHIETMTAGLVALERTDDAGRPPLIERIFRESHSLKGAARSVSLAGVEALCQELESIFAAMKREDLKVSTGLLDAIHPAVGVLGTLCGSLGVAPSSEGEKKEQQALATLKRIVRKTANESAEPPAVAVRSQPRASFSAHSAPAACVGSAPPDPPAPRTVAAMAAPDTVRVSTRKLGAILLEAEELVGAKIAARERAAELRALAADLAGWNQRRVGQAARRRRGHEATTAASDLLESEMLYARTLENSLRKVAGAAHQDALSLAAMTDAVLEDTKKMLLLPCSYLLGTLPAVLRDLARDQGKEADLLVHGEDIEIDRRVLDELKDPLIHLLRNCADHGIEKPDARRELGKSGRGSVTITVKPVEGSRVELTVGDDGAGINTDNVRKAAVRRGLIAADEAAQLAQADVTPLVFRSGLSTSPIVTDLSGRGLGLAIVREKVEKLGGTIAVTSAPGAGTTFCMLVPLSLATFRGVFVEVAGRRFAIPTASVERVGRVKPDEIKTVENRQTIALGKDAVSLVRLRDVLELSGPDGRVDGAARPVVVVRAADRRVAFLVDEVQGEQEVLVKRLGQQLARVRNVAGACISGSGAVIPILNVVDLVESASTAGAPGPIDAAKAHDTVPERRGRLLIVEDSITARTLVKSILEGAGYEVVATVDGLDALTRLKTEPFDLVVSDVDMPRMNGFELTARIRADKKLGELPVVLVTALGSQKDREYGIEVGANAYIAKSDFDQSNLLEIIRRLL
ncbi:MAG: response regulator [Acidobacteria bacterium]|nr:response regulator [Acidobacteriota bacterium]